ncbi:hypothetical protein Tco_0609383 [Tanacetum coccineum]
MDKATTVKIGFVTPHVMDERILLGPLDDLNKLSPIVLYSLPPDVYAIVNHHKVAKDIWDRVKLLMQGTKLSLQEKECKLYDEFNKPVQVNTKFLTTLPPEWSKFVSGVKFARDLLTTNYDQLYSYLEQPEAHANETRLMRERYQDPLAFLLQGFLYPTINLELPLIQETRPLFKTTGLLCNKFKGRKDKVMLVLAIRARQCTLPKRLRNAAWFKEKAMLTEAQEASQILDEEQLAFLADPSILDDAYDSDCDDVSNAKAVLMANLSNYGSDVISEVSHSETYHNDMDNQSVHAMQDFEQNPYSFPANEDKKKKESKYMENEIDLEKKIKKLDNIVYKVGQSTQTVHMLAKPKVFYDDTHKQALGYQNPFYLKKAQRIKPTLYDGSVISSQHATSHVIDDEETLNLEELNKLSEDFGKRFVPQQELSAEHAFWLQTSNPNTEQSNISPGRIEAPSELPKKGNGNDRLLQQIMSQDVLLSVMNSTTLNGESVNLEMQRSESCDKCFDLDAEFLKSQNSYNQNALEIPKYFENNDLKAQLQAKDTTICKLKEHIKSMRENDKEEKVKQDMDEIETINIELEHSVAKLLSENERLHKEIGHLKQIYKDQFDSIKRTRVRNKEHSESLILQLNSKYVENADLTARIQDKVFVITSLKNDLRKLKGKEIVENDAQIPIATTIALVHVF